MDNIKINQMYIRINYLTKYECIMIQILQNTVTFLKRVSLKDNIKHNEINIILYISKY